MKKDPIPLEDFAELLTKEIKNSQLTAKEVFKKANIPSVYLSRWRNNDVRPPYYNEIAKIANILDRPVEIFIYGYLDEPHVKVPLNEFRNYLVGIESKTRQQIERIQERII
jgi:transcriptional regulator with XRE-family HTH domain